jgi:hypothetical protein
MKMPVSKEQFVTTAKRVLSYATIIGALVLGFSVGRYTQNFPPKKEVVSNPYAKAFASDEISIAVNEANELMLVERKTGKYIVYSDEIGMTIFRMYTNRIYQNAKSND